MIELLYNCPHGSEIATYAVRSGPTKWVRKTASTPDGLKTLKCELSGREWYAERRYRNKDLRINALIREPYMRLDIPWIEGHIPNYLQGLARNTVFIQKAIAHYAQIWSVTPEDPPMHGDFSLGNTVWNQDGAHVIDWEHFHPHTAPWGFDALNLLFEVLWYDADDHSQLGAKQIEILTRSIVQLRETGHLSPLFRNAPLHALRQFMRDHEFLWGGQLKRMPVLHFTDTDAKKIDDLLVSSLDRTA